MMKKSWKEKFEVKTDCEIKVIKKPFCGYDTGSKMLIPTPKIVDEYIKSSKKGYALDIKIMRKELSKKYNADFTCPLTTSIFLRIVAEYNYEKLINRNSIDDISPFWRMIEPCSKLADKLSFQKNFIIQKRQEEKFK